MTEGNAERDWHTEARVRIVSQCGGRAPDAVHGRTFRPGEQLTMIQWGRRDHPVDRDTWWTSKNIDTAIIIRAEHVEVLEVLTETPPY